MLCKARDPRHPLHITSIKANIGHCEAASGGAALAKLLLMLQHSKIPPQPLLETLNSRIDELGTDGALINQQAASWNVSDGKLRLAMLNNFGAAGSNAALILQEYLKPRIPAEEKSSSDMTYCFGTSAKDEETLQRIKQELIAFLASDSNSDSGSDFDLEIPSLADLCYTSTARRQLHKYRLSCTASSVPDLVDKLKQARVVEATDDQPPVVFLFSGQGSQYLGMGKGLMEMFPEFNRTVMRCHRSLIEWGMPSCLDVINPPSDTERDPQNASQLQAFQTGVFVLEVALAQLLVSFGIYPDVVAGHR